MFLLLVAEVALALRVKVHPRGEAVETVGVEPDAGVAFVGPEQRQQFALAGGAVADEGAVALVGQFRQILSAELEQVVVGLRRGEVEFGGGDVPGDPGDGERFLYRP